MYLTKHARMRSKQRRIPREIVDMILVKGVEKKISTDETEYQLDKNTIDHEIYAMKRKIKQMEWMKNVILIVAANGNIKTVYKKENGYQLSNKDYYRQTYGMKTTPKSN